HITFETLEVFGDVVWILLAAEAHAGAEVIVVLCVLEQFKVDEVLVDVTLECHLPTLLRAKVDCELAIGDLIRDSSEVDIELHAQFRDSRALIALAKKTYDFGIASAQCAEIRGALKGCVVGQRGTWVGALIEVIRIVATRIRVKVVTQFQQWLLPARPTHTEGVVANSFIDLIETGQGFL